VLRDDLDGRVGEHVDPEAHARGEHERLELQAREHGHEELEAQRSVSRRQLMINGFWAVPEAVGQTLWTRMTCSGAPTHLKDCAL
jgi:hypothetical protein